MLFARVAVVASPAVDTQGGFVCFELPHGKLEKTAAALSSDGASYGHSGNGLGTPGSKQSAASNCPVEALGKTAQRWNPGLPRNARCPASRAIGDGNLPPMALRSPVAAGISWVPSDPGSALNRRLKQPSAGQPARLGLCVCAQAQAATFWRLALPTPSSRSSLSRLLSTALASPNTMAVWGSSNRALAMPA